MLAAALEGRVDTMMVEREAEIAGMRCRDFDLLATTSARAEFTALCRGSLKQVA